MATKKRVTVPAVSPEDARAQEKDADIETATDTMADTDVEQSDNNAVPSIGSVEGSGLPTHRVDVESGSEVDVGDIERGPA
jgi:hypothetical protein